MFSGAFPKELVYTKLSDSYLQEKMKGESCYSGEEFTISVSMSLFS